VAKVRVYELAKEFGVESKAVMDQLKEMGEFVRSASSTIEAPVVRRLKEAFSAKAADQPAQGNQGTQGARPKPGGQAAPRDGAAVKGQGRWVGDPRCPWRCARWPRWSPGRRCSCSRCSSSPCRAAFSRLL